MPMAMCLTNDYKLIRSIKISYEEPVFLSLTGWDPLVFSLYWPSQISLIRTYDIHNIYIYIYIKLKYWIPQTQWLLKCKHLNPSWYPTQLAMHSGHLTHTCRVTWSQDMIPWLSSMMAWLGCPLPEPRYLLLCKGCPAKFRHTIHKCEKQMGLKPYTLKLTQVCVKTFKP